MTHTLDFEMTRRSWLGVLIASVLGVAGWFIAPAPWSDESPVVRFEDPGSATLERAWPAAAESWTEGPVEIRLPTAWRADAPVRVCVRGATLDARLSLEWADGPTIAVPIAQRTDDAGCRWASIRPPVSARAALALLGLMVVLLLSEAIPLHFSALLIPVLASISGILTSNAALAPFFDPIIALFFAGFMIAEAMSRSGLDRTIAVRLVRSVGSTPVGLFVALLMWTGFLSMWMSNTAAMAVMLPIVMAVTEPLHDNRLRRGMVLAVAYAATIGGVGSAVGSASNGMAMSYLAEIDGQAPLFVDWFRYGLPFVLLMLPATGLVVWHRLGVGIDRAHYTEAMQAWVGAARTPRLDRSQAQVLAVFAGVVVLWLTEAWHPIDAAMAGLTGVVALGALGRVGQTELRHISWDALLVFGGGLCLGQCLVVSGASDWIASQLGVLAALPSWVAVAAVGTMTLLLSAVASNTAAAATILPLTLPLANVIGVDPGLLVVTAAIASSIDFALVVGTPPTMMAYATGLFTVRDIFRSGVVLDLLGLLVLCGALPLFWWLTGTFS